MAEGEATATHSAYLELQEERLGMQEGYRFLDEKRLVLAGEIITQLGQHGALMAELSDLFDQALAALTAAVVRHGLEALSLYPALSMGGESITARSRAVLGVVLLEIDAIPSPPPAAPVPVLDRSPEAESCREAFQRLIPHVARLAVIRGNLERLQSEYTQTARRARALEDVLIPEIDTALRQIASALEEVEREDAVRVRLLAR